jgi:ATP-dependent helicase/nuclease subunit A
MSDDPRTDVEARQRAATEFATTFLVEAGAGTGKTTVLLSRLLAVLRSGRSRVDRLAAITFSEKAAAEIRIRLRTELELALAGPLTDEERTNLRNACWQLERAQITTVHAFCAALLRERPVEARVDPQFSTLSQFEAQLVQTSVWREWLTQAMDHSPTVLKQALRVGLSFAHIETLRDFVLEHRDCLSLLPAPAPSSVAELQAHLPQLLARLREQKSACRTAADRAFAHIQRLEMLVPKNAEAALWEQFVRYEPREIVAGAAIGSKTNWRPATTLEEVRTLFRQIAEVYSEARADWLHNLSLDLVQWLEGYIQAYSDKKREQSQLDFTDLLLLTRDLLKTNPEVRRYFQRRFDCLLVDEFQDTDPLQAEIVFFLAEQEPRATQWLDVTLRPGKLFLVGDPQQSIYRFRRADLEVYSQVRTAIARQGEVLILADNFRTRAPVLGWMNETFAPAFAETASDQPTYQPLAATRRESTGRDLITVPIPAALLPARATRDDLRRAEARTIAAMLKQAVTYGSLAVWGDKAKDYRDVAVLFRTYHAMEAYEEAFANAGVPYRIVGGRRYTSRHEIEDLRVLLLAIERPTDPSLLVAVLRSSMFGFSDEELAQFVSEGGRFDALHAKVPATVPSADRFVAAFATVRRLYTDAAELSPAALLHKLYSSTHLIPLFAVRPHGAQRVANLLKLIDIAQALAPRGVQTLAAFNRFLAQQEVAGEEEEAVLTEDDDNAVRLLTIHKAKGLEFPVVILADMADRPSRGRVGKTGIVERLSGTLELRIGPQTLTCTTRGWQKAESREQEREVAEEWRLRYVAAARVRDHLLIPLWPKIEQEVGEQLKPDNDEVHGVENKAGFSLSGAEHMYTYHIDLAQIEKEVPSVPPSPLITSVLPNVASLRVYERWQAERQATIEKGQTHSDEHQALTIELARLSPREGTGQ